MLWCLTIISASIGGIGYFVSKGDVVAAASLGIIMLLGMSGYRLRFSGFISMMTGFVVAWIYTGDAGAALEPTVTGLLRGSKDAGHLASCSLAGSFITLAVTTFMRSIARMFCRPDSMLEHSDCMGGFMIGSAQGVGVALLAISAVLVVEPLARKQRPQDGTIAANDPIQRAASSVLLAADKIRSSCLYPVVDRLDPFDWAPKLKEIKSVIKESEDSDMLSVLRRAVSAPAQSVVATVPTVVPAMPISNTPPQSPASVFGTERPMQVAAPAPAPVPAPIPAQANAFASESLSERALAALLDDPMVRRQVLKSLEAQLQLPH